MVRFENNFAKGSSGGNYEIYRNLQVETIPCFGLLGKCFVDQCAVQILFVVIVVGFLQYHVDRTRIEGSAFHALRWR